MVEQKLNDVLFFIGTSFSNTTPQVGPDSCWNYCSAHTMAHRALTGFWGTTGQLQTFTWFHSLIAGIKSSCTLHTMENEVNEKQTASAVRIQCICHNINKKESHQLRQTFKLVLISCYQTGFLTHSSVIGQTNKLLRPKFKPLAESVLLLSGNAQTDRSMF